MPESADSTNAANSRYSSDVAFTPTVKAIQARKGSRHGYAKMEERGGWQHHHHARPRRLHRAPRPAFSWRRQTPTASPTSSIAAVRPASCTCSTTRRSAFADFSGNRQYITQGNLADNPKAHLFLIDYANRQRIKIWGEARIVEDDAELMRQADAGRLQGAARSK